MLINWHGSTLDADINIIYQFRRIYWNSYITLFSINTWYRTYGRKSLTLIFNGFSYLNFNLFWYLMNISFWWSLNNNLLWYLILALINSRSNILWGKTSDLTWLHRLRTRFTYDTNFTFWTFLALCSLHFIRKFLFRLYLLHF